MLCFPIHLNKCETPQIYKHWNFLVLEYVETMPHAFLIYWKWIWLSLIFVIVIVITIIMSIVKILVTNSSMQSIELKALTFAI